MYITAFILQTQGEEKQPHNFFTTTVLGEHGRGSLVTPCRVYETRATGNEAWNAGSNTSANKHAQHIKAESNKYVIVMSVENLPFIIL